MMKKGVSLILLIVMFILVIILGYLCIQTLKNNSSFFNIKYYKSVKSQIQDEINDTIYKSESYMGNSVYIEPGYLSLKNDDENTLPKILSKDLSYTIHYDSMLVSNLPISDSLKIYLDENGIVHLKYLIFDI